MVRLRGAGCVHVLLSAVGFCRGHGPPHPASYHLQVSRGRLPRAAVLLALGHLVSVELVARRSTLVNPNAYCEMLYKRYNRMKAYVAEHPPTHQPPTVARGCALVVCGTSTLGPSRAGRSRRLQ